MKYLLFILLTLEARAAITFVNPTPGYTDKITFEYGKNILKKTVNFTKSEPLSLGTSIHQITKQDEKILSSMIEVEKNLERSEKELKNLGLDHSKELQAPPHEVFYVVDGIKISPRHSAFKTLDLIRDSLMKVSWKLQDGITLNSAHTSYAVIKDGKTIKTLPYAVDGLRCDRPTAPRRCRFDEGTIIFER